MSQVTSMKTAHRQPRRTQRPLILAAVGLALLLTGVTYVFNGSSQAGAATVYPVHTNVTAAVFWVGEPVGGGSSENNAISAWDDAWEAHYGGFDDPNNRVGFHPVGFTPMENPFYFDFPYDDFGSGGRRADAMTVVPWAGSKTWGANESMLKNRWAKFSRNGVTCYAQWEDAGPYVYDDANYVFGANDARPRSTQANNAGADVSPALRDCLQFVGANNVDNKMDWQFVEASDVPAGPWTEVVTTRGTYWPGSGGGAGTTPTATRTATPIGTVTATAVPPTATAVPPTPTVAPGGFAVKVYTDGLTNAWSNTSWGASVNMASTSPVYLGTNAASFSITSAWGGFFVRSGGAISANGLSTLSFAMRASGSSQRYIVSAVNPAGSTIGRGAPLANFGGDPTSTAWRVYEIPLDATGLNVAGQNLGGFYIQGATSATQPVAYIDEIGFRAATAGSTPIATPPPATPRATSTAPVSATWIPPVMTIVVPTATPVVPTATPAPPTATPVPPTQAPAPVNSASSMVFGDALATGWRNASWKATVNFAETAQVWAGTKSASFSVTAAWGGFYVSTTTPVATSGYTNLKFAMRASAANQQYSVGLIGAGGTFIGTQVVLRTAGGDPVAGAWTSYAIPFGAGGFNVAGQTVLGVVIQDNAGTTQPVVYLDELRFE